MARHNDPVTNHPRLVQTSDPADPAGLVLVLHGGASRRGNPMVSPTQLSVIRMIPVAQRVARAGRHRLGVFRLLNSTRGWDAHHTPVDDVAWALGELRRRFDRDLPVSLVGHSLGGRAAVLAAARPEVRSVVALNPWVYPSDGAADLTGRRILIVHGTNDRIAQPSTSVEMARGLSRTAAVEYVRVDGGKHAMLRRHSVFDRLAADFASSTLLDAAPARPTPGLVVRDE